MFYLKELLTSFVPTNFKSIGSLQQILESHLSPPPQTRFTLKKTASFRKFLVPWWTLLHVFIKSWFTIPYVLCKPGFHFLVSSLDNFEINLTYQCNSRPINSLSEIRELRLRNVNRVLIGNLNMNSIRNKFDQLKDTVLKYIDILILTETKLDETFLSFWWIF